jgi:hypothetical protein
MLTKEYLAERIAYHGEIVEAHVLAHDRALATDQPPNQIEHHLNTAARHAAIVTALTAIAAAKP